MSASKYKSIIVCSMLSTGLALMSACGSDSHPQKQRIGAVLPNSHAAKTDKNGKPINTGGTGGGNLAVDPKNSTALSQLDNADKALQPSTPIPREKLAAGTYKLTTVNSSLRYMSGKPSGEELIAMDNVTVTAGSQVSFSAPNSQVAGTMSNESDSGRNLDLPSQFDVKLPWTPNRNDPSNSNFVLHNQLSGSVGSYTLKDEQENAQDLQSSLLKILASSPSSDGTYSAKGDSGVAITLKIFSIDEQTVRFFLSFTEAAAATTKSTTATQTATLIRNIYLDYSVTAPEAAANTSSEAPAAPAATDGNSGATLTAPAEPAPTE